MDDVHRTQIVVVVEVTGGTRPVDLALPTAMQIAVLVLEVT